MAMDALTIAAVCGAGKTHGSISLSLHQKFKHVLIFVDKTSTAQQWRRTILQREPLVKIQIVRTKYKTMVNRSAKYVILTYHAACGKHKFDDVPDNHFELALLDESHTLRTVTKKTNSHRSNVVDVVYHKCQHIMLLSATSTAVVLGDQSIMPYVHVTHLECIAEETHSRLKIVQVRCSSDWRQRYVEMVSLTNAGQSFVFVGNRRAKLDFVGELLKQRHGQDYQVYERYGKNMAKLPKVLGHEFSITTINSDVKATDIPSLNALVLLEPMTSDTSIVRIGQAAGRPIRAHANKPCGTIFVSEIGGGNTSLENVLYIFKLFYGSFPVNIRSIDGVHACARQSSSQERKESSRTIVEEVEDIEYQPPPNVRTIDATTFLEKCQNDVREMMGLPTTRTKRRTAEEVAEEKKCKLAEKERQFLEENNALDEFLVKNQRWPKKSSKVLAEKRLGGIVDTIRGSIKGSVMSSFQTRRHAHLIANSTTYKKMHEDYINSTAGEYDGNDQLVQTRIVGFMLKNDRLPKGNSCHYLSDLRSAFAKKACGKKIRPGPEYALRYIKDGAESGDEMLAKLHYNLMTGGDPYAPFFQFVSLVPDHFLTNSAACERVKALVGYILTQKKLPKLEKDHFFGQYVSSLKNKPKRCKEDRRVLLAYHSSFPDKLPKPIVNTLIKYWLANKSRFNFVTK
jgi:superfamily II DNA or RNA helicase